MINNPMKTTQEFLAEEVYLPGYMVLSNGRYDRNGVAFNFRVKEPPVDRAGIVKYLTPRGLHICVSQASYALVEHMIRKGLVSGFEIPTLRKTLLEGRVKMTELCQKFRREIGLSEPVPGRLDIRKFRKGKIPILKVDFNFANGAITGNLMSVIVPNPVPQTNTDISRNG